MIVDTLNPNCLLSQLFNGTLTEKEKGRLINSIRKYHKKLKKEKKTEMKYYRV